MITLTNISKYFRSEEVETCALRNVSMEVRRGEFVAVMGPSGCGKTTLLNILGMLDEPTGGNYILDGQDTGRMTEEERTDLRKEKLGFVFQSFNLIDELSVYENVELPLLYLGLPPKERRQRVLDILERMSMAHRAQHFPAQLSGGQQQRVAMARAVVSRPQIILADEPTGNLDSKHGRDVMEMLSDLHREGTTIVMVTHSQHDAEYAERVVNLFDGEVVSELHL